MKAYWFAFKRMVRRPLFMIMLVVYVLAVMSAGFVGKEAGLPAAGVYDASKSPESARIVSHLTENGFVECDSRDTLIDQVGKGQLNCGVILPEDLVALMKQNDLEHQIPWITAPTSFVPKLYSNHVAAALYREYVPYITAPLFDDTAVPSENVHQTYEELFAEGYVFSFDTITVNSTSDAEAAVEKPLVTGAAAILLCAVIFAFCADLADTSFQETAGRIGLSRAITMTVIPGLLVRTVLAACAGCLGLLLANSKELIVPILIYSFLLSGIGLILSALLHNVRLLYTLLALIMVGSVALCPIFTDLTILSPVLTAVRYLFPPYWLWILPDHQTLGIVAAVAAQLGGMAVLWIKYAVLKKYRFRCL